MTKADVLNLVVSELIARFAELGFSKKSRDALVRPIPGGRQIIGVALLDYRPEFDFSLSFCVRMDAVEELFHQFSGALTPKDQASSVTTITRLEYFTGDPAMIRANSASDVAAAFQRLDPVIRDRVVPFFRECADLAALDRLVNEERPSIDTTQPPYGQMHSIILAHLAGNKRFAKIVSAHRQSLSRGATPREQAIFAALAEYLERLQRN